MNKRPLSAHPKKPRVALWLALAFSLALIGWWALAAPRATTPVRVVFDPKQVSYAQLLEHFWRTIDPTVKDCQFCDIGTPYRTAIFAATPEQLQAAQASRATLAQNKPFAEPIQTQIARLDDFYPAETEHQDYHQNNPLRYDYCRKSCARDARLKPLWGALAVAQ